MENFQLKMKKSIWGSQTLSSFNFYIWKLELGYEIIEFQLTLNMFPFFFKMIIWLIQNKHQGLGNNYQIGFGKTKGDVKKGIKSGLECP